MRHRTTFALLVAVPLAVGLPLAEQLRYYARHRYRETATIVPAGGTGRLAHASWRLAGIRRTGDGVRVRLSRTPLDPTGVSWLGIDVEARDASGRRWHLDPSPDNDLGEPGRPAIATFQGEVPAGVADQVEPAVRALPLRRAPDPVPVLLFRR